ncbi:MAG: 23S rRNA (adenine(2503)-C(2))-methyltransferase RlmN [Clostridiales bacterium]|jgi:23S rRNA (adenine2503-C2)-methyltransferase|nr:23S rRNA (adenine(2503)-C(2))-methyltransferase RlmN [Clostridiales bacterium]
MERIDIGSMLPQELSDLMSQLGEKPFRGRQIFQWIHAKQVESFEEMTDLPLMLRLKLSEEFDVSEWSKILQVRPSSDAQSTKYLLRLAKNTIIESVSMSYSYGASACVSTQAGCDMGCSFCASAEGLDRNLSAGEMCGQVYSMQKTSGARISHVVLMGSGEPMANYDGVVKFIRLISNEAGQNISQRRIAVSTCGIVPGIYKLAGEGLSVTLAVSLHAPNDEIRSRIMPVAKAYPMDELLKACRSYAKATKRRVTYEYAMIKGENDSAENAEELAKLIKGSLCHVNLIPVNDVGKNFTKSGKREIEAFASKLAEYGVEVTIRRKLGSDINAACGQLRSERIG